MANERSDLPEDVLARATKALQQTAVPDGPSPEVLNRTLAALQGAATQKPVTTTQRILNSKAMTQLAAAAVLVAALSGFLFWICTPRTTSIAFADVLKTVREVRSAKYKQVMRVDVPGQGAETMTSEVLVADPLRMRFTTPEGVGITDFRQGKVLLVMHTEKQAILMDLTNSPPRQINLLKQFQEAVPSSGRPIGQKEIAGRQARGFEMTEQGVRLQVWVDPETKLPLLVEGDTQAAPARHVTITDFAWNVPVDESLMSLTPPAGYQMLPAKALDISPLGDKDLTTGLKTIAELNGGTFPAGIDLAALQQVLMQRAAKRKELKGKSAAPDIGAEMQTANQLMRMLMFIGNPKNGEDWHYAGEGVPLGQAGRPIFWYRPKGAATYRVINADLTVHDVPPENLPKIPSKAVTNPMGLPPPAAPK